MCTRRIKEAYRRPKATSTFAITSYFLFCLILMPPIVKAQNFSDWSEAVNLGPVVNTACAPGKTNCNDQHPALSKDGLSLYFSSDRPGGCGKLDLWVTHRDGADSPWQTPLNLGCTVNSGAIDMAPSLSTDGHTLYFHSFRPDDNCGGGDIYVSHRKDTSDDLGWEAPININRVGRDPNAPLECGELNSQMLINTPNTDAGPDIFNDDTTGATILYFTRSNLPTQVGDFDIYTATLGQDGTWGAIVRDNELSSPFRDTRVAIRARDGLEMYITTERPRPDGLIDFDFVGNPVAPRDIWVSTRNSTLDPWSTPEALPRGTNTINSSGFDGAPALSWDGLTMIFYSNRGGAGTGNDLFMSTRTKVTGP